MTEDTAAVPPEEQARRLDTARSILDQSKYLVLATAGADGRPWATPVYYATVDFTDFFWVSDPAALHSRNIAQRPEVGFVVFDSRVAPGTGQGVYTAGVAERVPEDEVEAGLAVFSAANLADGLSAWTPDTVQEPSRLRLYRARAEEQWVLEADRDVRVPVVAGSRD
jgi:nitroimidazol reductase NimA-like FMN-containing flavoprotein (pyridoxamine 5'-phosphate oxidase superfamily)